jgi:hypothetical protein
MFATRKKRWAESHADTAGADMLKRARCGSSYRLEIQNEITRPSKATMTVPAAGPYSRTAVNTKVSEMEIDADEEGSLTVAEPLINVRAARMNHW